MGDREEERGLCADHRKGEDGASSGGKKAGVGQQQWPKLIKEKVSDHASNICLSGPAEVKSPTGTSGGQLPARARQPAGYLLMELVTELQD